MVRIKIADTVLVNGKAVTVDQYGTIAEAVAIKEGKILHVGSSQEVKQLVGEETRIIDLDGRTVLPGFIDAHTHIEGIAKHSFFLDVHIPPLKNVEEILEKIKKRVEETPRGEWIIGQGGFGQALPKKDELDTVAPEHPVVLLYSAHDCELNSKALEVANISKDTPVPPGGKIEVDLATGEPTGLLRECYGILPIPPPSHEKLKEAIKEVIHTKFIRQGVTSIYTLPSSPDSIRIYQELLDNDELPLRLRIMYTVNRPPFDDYIYKQGLITGFGNDWIRIGGVKVFVDGAGPTAAYYDPPGQKERWSGKLKITQEKLNKIVLKAHKTGQQIWIHAIGDKALDMSLDAIESALRELPRDDHRHRIEHAAIARTTMDHLDRMKKMGVIPVPTSAWIYLGTGGWEGSEERYIYRTLIDQGFLPPGNSDSLGSMPESMSPIFSIWCAVARKTRTGELNCPEQGITVLEALRLYSMNSAYSGFEENIKGSIEEGKFADLIVLQDDPLTVQDVDEIKDIEVDMTLVDGKIVYENPKIREN